MNVPARASAAAPPVSSVPSPAFHRYCAVTLVFVLAVILWGAYVRASGSGAGCGSHWPTCNGEVIPRVRSIATKIEFTHRATSGIAFVLVVGQLVWAWRRFPRGHAARRAAVASMAVMVSEAAIGAGLVVFKMVAENESVARAAWVTAHLLNTFALVASVVLTGFYARPRAPSPDPVPRRLFAGLLVALMATLLVAVSGAIAALGDTLFPARTFAEGWQQDLSPTAHLFVRLRVWHPVLAVVTGIGLLVIGGMIVASDRPRGARGPATLVAALVLCQLGAGLVNLALLAPIPLQLVHLLLADLVWIALVRLTATLRPRALPAAVA